MRAARALLASELRRHAPLVAAALAVVLAVPSIHRLAAVGGPLRASGWALAAARWELCALAPLVGLVLALQTWSADRAEGTLGWLYSRPLPAGWIFGVRAAAVYLAQALVVATALAVGGVDPRDLLSGDDFYVRLLVAMGLGALVASVPFGLFFSALSSRPGRAAAGAVLLAPWLVLVPLVGVTWLLVAWHRELEGTPWLLTSALSLGGLAAAWWTVRRAPADGRRRRRGWGALAVALVAASALGAASLAGAVAYDPAKVVAVRSLGEGAELHFVESFDWRARRFHPFVVAGGRSRRAGPATFALPAVLVHRASGRAMVPGGDGAWRIVERDSRPVEVASAAGEPGPEPAGIVGWSPGGDRFAWRLEGDLGRRAPAVLVAGLDGATRSLPLAGMKLVLEPNWNAIWLDDDRLLVASDWTGVALAGGWTGALGADERAGTPRQLNWRAVLDVAAGGGLDRRRLPLGWRLETPGPVLGLPFAPAAYSDDVLALPTPRRGRAPLGWLTDGRVSRLIELTAGALPEPLWETDTAIRDTLGVLPGGEAVWIERRPGGTEVVRLVAGEEAPRGACVFPAGRRPWIFRGAAGRWALWAERGEDGGPGERLLGCELDRGITRELDGLGPLGWLSADVVAGGLAVPGRWRIDLPEIGAEIGAETGPERGAEVGP